MKINGKEYCTHDTNRAKLSPDPVDALDSTGQKTTYDIATTSARA